MIITCAHCGLPSEKREADVKRARNAGLNLYCNRACAGLGRRKPPKSKEQKIAEKKEYDAKRRLELADQLKAAKREYHKRTYDPAAAAIVRKKRMPYHVEYCRRPEYRAKKHEYDVMRGAKERYGEFWEAFLLTQEIRNEALRLAGGDYELRLSKGYFDRTTTKRKRDYERANCKEPEISALGNLERFERR